MSHFCTLTEVTAGGSSTAAAGCFDGLGFMTEPDDTVSVLASASDKVSEKLLKSLSLYTV